MAKLKGILKIEGTLGDLSIYKTKDGYIVRRKWGPNKKRRKADPAFKKAEANSTEFGNCSQAGKLFRDALAVFLKDCADKEINTRVNKLMIKIKNLDKKSTHGKRTVAKGISDKDAAALLNGFNFNAKCELNTILKKPVEVDLKKGAIKIECLTPKKDLKGPKGASHARFGGGLVKIDFEKKKFEVQSFKAVEIPINNSSGNVDLKTDKKKKMPAPLVVLRLSFVQEVNGQMYAMTGEKGEVGAIVAAVGTK